LRYDVFASRARACFECCDVATARTCWPRPTGCADSLSEQDSVHDEHGEYGEHEYGEQEEHEHEHHGHGEHGQSAAHTHDEHEQHRKRAERPSGRAHDARRIS
jgi:hypothetical protein